MHLALAALHALREQAGPRQCDGLSDEALAPFLDTDPALARAIDEAVAAASCQRAAHPELVGLPEDALVARLQEGYVNFYDDWAINPYVPLAARGPWIVTHHGAVLHDSGGYGMLGLGHAPDEVMRALGAPWVVANIMTASFSQARFMAALRQECGHTRPRTEAERAAGPFVGFLCMNSGSEAVTVAARISDILAKRMTGPGGRHEGRIVKFLALEGGFHGRTDRPAQASDSTRRKYRQHLASFVERDNLYTIPPNDVTALREAFATAERQGWFFELMLAEPVMGEGNPGMAMTRAFYDEARRLTRDHGGLLLIDSVQAGLRATGALSIVDYPGFEDCEAPDLEAWSKAINAAQYPLSVLGIGPRAANLYQRGVYGNTMTTNPRALEVGLATLRQVDDALRANIRDRGVEFVQKLRALAEEVPGVITGVQGTGLLLSASLDPRFEVCGHGGVEERCRLRGLGVIHGGANALRFTPHFRITSAEIDLVVGVLRQVFRELVAEREAAAK